MTEEDDAWWQGGLFVAPWRSRCSSSSGFCCRRCARQRVHRRPQLSSRRSLRLQGRIHDRQRDAVRHDRQDAADRGCFGRGARAGVEDAACRSDNRAQPEEIPAAQEASEQARFARPEPNPRHQRHHRHATRPMGPKRRARCSPRSKRRDSSENSASSRLEALQNYGIVERVGDGRWRLKKAA